MEHMLTLSFRMSQQVVLLCFIWLLKLEGKQQNEHQNQYPPYYSAAALGSNFESETGYPYREFLCGSRQTPEDRPKLGYDCGRRHDVFRD